MHAANDGTRYEYTDTKASLLRKEAGDKKRETIPSSYMFSQLDSNNENISIDV